jgi:hypothetical protein
MKNNMNETAKNKKGWRVPRMLLIWLASFTLIALAMGIALLTTDSAPKKSPDILLSLLFGVLGASISVCLLVFIHWLRCWRNVRRLLIGLAILATLIAIFYAEEDWRGKRDWENCKRELEAKGMVLDWEKFIPPPVPDDQNFFTASTNILLRFHKAQTPAQSDAAAQLSWLRLPPLGSNSFPVLDTAKSKPLVVAELTVLPPTGAALQSANDSLIIKLDDPAARERVRGLIQTTIGQSINGAAGFQFSELQLSNIQPARIFVQTETPPSISDLESLIPSDTVTNIGRLRVAATIDKNIFQVLLTGVRITSAADYLKWSDQFEPAFDEIREALKRPYAFIPGDYSRPFYEPIPNFVAMRSVAQTLAQRTQCEFLLGEPDKALRELTLMHDMCRILELPPNGKPINLVEAMINVSLSGLYASTIADGLQRHAWQEPQLATLQEQLKKVNVVPLVLEAFRTEPAAVCRAYETAPPPKLFSMMSMKINYRLLSIPRGWIYQNMVNIAVLEQKPLSGFDLANNTVSPRLFDDANRDINNFIAHKSPYRFLVAIAIPNYVKALQTTAFNQTLVNEGQIVCALEHYRLAHGEYPETLDALVPQFIEKLPHDIIGGQPLHYRRMDPPSQSFGAAGGKFLLYSIGWNETDDGGQVASKPDGSEDREKGDWVWRYPLK